VKIRDGFVSNSSSSSFVVAYNNSDKCKTCGRSDHDLYDIIESKYNASYSCSEETKCLANGLDEVIEYINDNFFKYSDNREESIKEMEDKIRNVMDNRSGWELLLCDVSYHDNIVNKIILEKEENNTLIKIWSDN